MRAPRGTSWQDEGEQLRPEVSRDAVTSCIYRLTALEHELTAVRGALAEACGRRLSIMEFDEVEVPVGHTGSAQSMLNGQVLTRSRSRLPPMESSEAKATAKLPDIEQPIAVDQAILRSALQLAVDQEKKEEEERQKRALTRARTKILPGFQVLSDASDQTAKHSDMVFVKHMRCLIPVIHPEAKLLLMWMIFGGIFIMYEAIVAPYYMAFDIYIDGPEYVISSLINAYFLCDIVVMFFTAYRDPRGQLIRDPKRIAARYLCGWLAFDMVASIPWAWIYRSAEMMSGSDIPPTAQLRLLRIFRFLRCTRLVKATTLASFSGRMSAWIESTSMQKYIDLVKLVGMLLLLVHWLACFWYFIGMANRSSKTWVSEYLETAFFDQVFAENRKRYQVAVYYIVMTLTTVGFGDTTPTNIEEIFFSTCLLALSWFVNASLISNMLNIVQTLNREKHMLSEKKAQLTRYMHWRAVPRRLRISIEQHLQFVWHQKRDYEAVENDIRNQLPPVLWMELCYWIYGKVLRSQPFLVWMKRYDVVIERLSSMVDSLIREKNDHIFRIGTPNVQIYILQSGQVWLSQNERIPAPPSADQGSQTSLGERKDNKDRRNSTSTTQSEGPEPLTARSLKAMIRSATSPVKAHAKPADVHHVFDGMLKKAQQEHADRQSFKQEIDITFASEPMSKAAMRMHMEDARLQRAAIIVQRKWRELKARKHFRRSSRSTSNVVRNKTIASGEVHAPAYFGESCLWAPIDTWENQFQPYSYSAICLCRSEVLIISRDAISDTIAHYSPWLGDRFEVFRRAVLESLGTVTENLDVELFASEQPSQGFLSSERDEQVSPRSRQVSPFSNSPDGAAVNESPPVRPDASSVVVDMHVSEITV